MQQYPLVRLADRERRADLLGGPALDVAHRNHGLLALGELADRGVDPLQRLALEQACSGSGSGNRFQPPG